MNEDQKPAAQQANKIPDYQAPEMSDDVADAFLTGDPIKDPLRPTADAAVDEEYEEAQDYKVILIKWVGLSLFFILGLFILFNFILKTYVVDGASMTPTFQDRDRVLLSVLGKTTSNLVGRDFIPKRGEVVVVSHKYDPSFQLIKRVIALPGERVVVKDGSVKVYNDEFPKGFNPDEQLELTELAKTDGSVNIVVPDKHIFVVGDNRVPGGSIDSRSDFGPVPLENIQGKVWLRFLPVTELTFF